jgi:phosphate transport system ATP-binding protein
MALSMHLYTVSTSVPDVPGSASLRNRGRPPPHRFKRQRHFHWLENLFASQKEMVDGKNKVEVSGLTVAYGTKEVLRNISLDIKPTEIFGVIGPAQSGKTTFLKVINRTLELIPSARMTGMVRVDGENVMEIKDVHGLRRKIGMVAPLPVGLPMSIYDNVAFAPRSAGIKNRSDLDERVERCLTQAALWEEVKDRLKSLGTKLSGGQQQRLTIARALSHDPEVLCLDEFSIAIDPVTTMRIEDVLKELRSKMTIILVTNLVQQARRLADRTAFFFNGDLIEIGDSETMFDGNTKDPRTHQYIQGTFG